MPEFIDPVFAKTSPQHSFSMMKTGSINSDTRVRNIKILFFQKVLNEEAVMQSRMTHK